MKTAGDLSQTRWGPRSGPPPAHRGSKWGPEGATQGGGGGVLLQVGVPAMDQESEGPVACLPVDTRPASLRADRFWSYHQPNTQEPETPPKGPAAPPAFPFHHHGRDCGLANLHPTSRRGWGNRSGSGWKRGMHPSADFGALDVVDPGRFGFAAGSAFLGLEAESGLLAVPGFDPAPPSAAPWAATSVETHA